MAIQFTAEQIALRDQAREFFQKEVAPVMAEIDARPDPKDCYPAELVRKASRIGLRTLPLPEQYGGVNADLITTTLLLVTMCEIEPGVGKTLSQCWKVSSAILQAGTEAQQKKFLPEFAKDHDYTCSILITEPDAASDNLLPYNDPKAGIATKAVPEGGDYLLSGSKNMASLVGFSKLLLVFARTDRSVPVRRGTTTFLVPHDLPGISYGHVQDKMGYRLYPNGEAFFDNVRVPKEWMLGGLNGGFDTFAKIFRGSVEMPATNLGICKGMYRIALEYAKQRVQGGKPIIEHAPVGLMLGEMAMLIDTLESYTFDIAQRVKTDPSYDVKKTRFGKVFSCECLLKMIGLGLDVVGSSGIMRNYPFEKLIRDGLSMLHGDGTVALNRLRVLPLLK